MLKEWELNCKKFPREDKLRKCLDLRIVILKIENFRAKLLFEALQQVNYGTSHQFKKYLRSSDVQKATQCIT